MLMDLSLSLCLHMLLTSSQYHTMSLSVLSVSIILHKYGFIVLVPNYPEELLCTALSLG